ncbi:MAG TPA: hypothetical protein VNK49_04265 [Anaerolineales bacterium]|nr:hypothetical protein [Anaerolineales bacterium]
MSNHKLNILLVVASLTAASLSCSLPSSGIQPNANPESTENAPANELPPGAPTESISQPPATAPSGHCDNPLLPVKIGATWNYKLSGPYPDTFTRTIVSIEESSFTDQDTFGSGTVRTGKWNCENGNLIALNPSATASATVSSAGQTSEFTTTSQSGVTLPAIINSGDTWSQSTTIEGTNLISGLTAQAKNEFTSNCTAEGIEAVTVPAGTFDAVKITCNTNMTITVQMEGISPPPISMSGTTTSWYAPGVGWIKSLGTGEDVEYTIELTSYTIP